MAATDLDTLACQISNDWLHERKNHMGKLPKAFEERLEQLEKLTRGNPKRCTCIAGRDSNNRMHAVICGAYAYIGSARER